MTELFATIESAIGAAEHQVNVIRHDHVYVYELNGQYGLLWHPEDRYIFSYLPDGAIVRYHGLAQLLNDGTWNRMLTWDARDGNATPEDTEVLKAFGPLGNLLLGWLNDKD